MRRRWIGVALGCLLALLGADTALAQSKVLIYSGTVGYRHANATEAIQPAVVDLIQSKLQAAGITSDYRSCNGAGTGAGTLPGCQNATTGNPAIFTAANLAQYDAIFFWQASSRDRDDTTGERLFTDAQQAAIEQFARGGGGIGAMHASVTMGAGQVTWPWWDAPGDSAIGALMPGHSATDANNIATVQVSDRNHPSTKDLPDSYRFGDEHYTFSSNVRGTHHVLMTLDEETYNVGTGITRMGADHPIAWCRMYEGARIWASSLGHFSAAYLENGGDNNLIKHLVGGVRYVAGTAGKDSDCGATVWTNFRRTVLADDLKGAIGMDIARDGKVYWTEIGEQAIQSEGRLRMYDPQTRATSTLLTIQTRADHQSSNDGVLGMALDPNFATNRHLYIYYSPRQDPGCNSCLIVGHNLISRFTLTPRAPLSWRAPSRRSCGSRRSRWATTTRTGSRARTTYSAHVGGGSISFDSNGDLYIGTGDDVDPFGQGGNNYAPLDQRYPQRYDARNTAANTNDLRGKILRIHPLAAGGYSIPAGNMFAPGTANTKPEIYAMGFRNPFTVAADPKHPGTVVVGEYGPDAGANSATRGPAGVIEWNRVTKPGFFGWPLCVGDNSAANTYFRYTFPSGPSGTRFDCAATEIANESPNNTGLPNIPGPAVGADVWHKRTGDHPARFAIPAQSAPQESVTGPIYNYDATNPSTTKWPAYYDGAWFILDRSQNWWRETRVKDDGSGILRVNGLFGSSQFGNPGHSYPIPVKFGPDGALYMATWGFDCCRAQLPTSTNGRLMRVDFIADEVDTTAPVVDATVTGTRNGAGDYLGRATLTLTASDSSGVARTEYSTDGGQNWTTYTAPVAFTTRGAYTVQYRATDRASTPNTSPAQTVTFSVVSGDACLPSLSDEFNSALDTSRWSFRHATTPASGTGAPSVADGSLVLPLGNNSLDLTRLGPIGSLGQPLPAGDFTLVAKVSAPGLDSDVGGTTVSRYAQVGLKIFQTNDNWIKVAHSRNADGNPTGSAQTYFEMTYEQNGTRTLGTRMGLAGTNLPTWWFRIVRAGNTITSAYSLTDPEVGANWVALSGSPNIDTVLPPASGPRYIGAYGGNGSISARYDYIRITPDNAVDRAAPSTSHTLAPAAPDGANGWYRSGAQVTLAAGDEGECVSGVDRTEHRVDGGAFGTYSTPFNVGSDGTHTVEYRSVDKAGNAETAKSVAVKIDATAPATTAATDGTGPVTLTLTAADATSGVALTEYQVSTAGVFKGFAAPRFAAAEWIPYDAANKPRFTAPGAYTVEYRSTDAAGNVEATKTVAFTIAAPSGDDTLAPVTTGSLDPAQPGPGKTYATPVTVNLSALDPAPAGPPAANFNVDAAGTQWSPSTVNLTAGDRVTWRFGPDAGFPHDVWVVPPGGNPNPNGGDVTEVTNGLVFPGGAPVSKTLTQTGTWTFLCKLHAGFSNGAWSGMTGTAVVTPSTVTNPPSGVDYTDYRVDGGDWVRKANDGGASPFASSLTVSAEGSHTVEYRSADEAGNVEAAKSLAFSIDLPDPGFPVIQAFADPSSGAAPLLVRYSATGFDPDGGTLSYKWEFADGVVFGRTVTRTYTQTGTYTAKLTATDDEGKQSTKDVPVVVTDPDVVPPTVSASSDVSRGPAPLRVQFSAAGDEDLDYAWDFGDGGTSLAQNPAHTYTAPGTYTAKVTVRGEGGATATDTVEVVVTNPAGNGAPSVEIAAVPASGRAPLDVLFTAEGTDPDDDELTYTWDFDDGSAPGSGESVAHRYVQGGTYTATVTASDGRGGTDTAEIAVVVGNPAGNQAPTVTANADPKSGTAPLTVEFSSHAVDADGDDLLVTWAFGDGGQAAGETATHTYTAAGTYTATVTATDRNGAAGTATVQIVVSAVQASPPPAAGADAAPAAPSQAAWFGVSNPGRTTLGGFGNRGLSVQVTCTEAMSGTATLTVASATRRALKLRSATLARGTVRCTGAGSLRVTLKPSKTVRRALNASRRTVKATLRVRLRTPGQPATQSSRTVTLARR